jgi:hypothetical protein
MLVRKYVYITQAYILDSVFSLVIRTVIVYLFSTPPIFYSPIVGRTFPLPADIIFSPVLLAVA